ncbi:hypothetical protein C0Q44_29080 [Paenibacillus sp. PCH8]|uniref:hypothetical protein n=1 Tax=Paenibacillus sp. PCH8 TaxID=2066524 RepID=UPI000CF9DB08|nr:hypothetical protein [Paenibacillus sp. PCH8]PQP80085.1 hypothetical protein C0Q44_29080 [Paenibacillus sp. PCH8]
MMKKENNKKRLRLHRDAVTGKIKNGFQKLELINIKSKCFLSNNYTITFSGLSNGILRTQSGERGAINI